MADTEYPWLDRMVAATHVPPSKLVQALELERMFHDRILHEESLENRKRLYLDIYEAVHGLYGQTSSDIYEGANPKDRIVRLFRKELRNKSVLDVGCGTGHFLLSIVRQLHHGKLVGIDISIPPLSRQHSEVELITSDIIEFDLGQQFDVVFSDQVIEHIAPIDLPTHLRSVRESLKDGGLFIVNMPNRLFGPSDITRLIDCSYSGKMASQGTHLNESTYHELIAVLRSNGFSSFRTTLPIPKVRSVFNDFRMSPFLLEFIEQNRFLIYLLRKMRYRRQCIIRFGITLICSGS